MSAIKGLACTGAALLLCGSAHAEPKKTPSKAAPAAVEIKELPTETLRLGVGMQKSLTVKGLHRVAVGDPKVADATVLDGSEVLLTGVAEGETSLLLWIGKDTRASYRVKVMKKTPEETASELQQLLSN